MQSRSSFLQLQNHTQTAQQDRLPHGLAAPRKSPTISIFRRFFSFGTPITMAAVSAAKTKAQGIIDENAVVVFSKSWCPYCKAAKQLLSGMGAKAYIVELDQVDDGSAIQEALEEISNQRTVPNIFIDHKHIGGNSDLQARKSQLPQLLKEANAL